MLPPPGKWSFIRCYSHHAYDKKYNVLAYKDSVPVRTETVLVVPGTKEKTFYFEYLWLIVNSKKNLCRQKYQKYPLIHKVFL